MVIIQVAGGLGNQLQQYALYRKFIKLGAQAKLDLSWFEQFEDHFPVASEQKATNRKCELNYFYQLPYEICSEREKSALTGSSGITGKLRRKLLPHTVHWYKESQMYDQELLNFREMYLSGYFACEKYYADILPELQKMICFPPSHNLQNEEMAGKIQNCNAVSVHIRRGDYLQPENEAMFGNICTDQYYDAALDYIRERIENPHFFVFSDDIPYVRKRYTGNDTTIVDINHGKDSFYDMYLMSLCRANICANSTFSFWGARLNKNPDKWMIRPTTQKNGQIFEEKQMKELWKNWVFIDAMGTIFDERKNI